MFRLSIFLIVLSVYSELLKAQDVDFYQYTYEAYTDCIENADTFLIQSNDSVSKVSLNFERIDVSRWNDVWKKLCSIKHLRCLTIQNCDLSKLSEVPIRFGSDLIDLRLIAIKNPEPLLNVLRESKGLICFVGRVKKIDERITSISTLRYLFLAGSQIKVIPEEITNLKHLQYLNLSNCERLKELPVSISELDSIQVINCGGCRSLQKISICNYKTDVPPKRQDPSSLGYREHLTRLRVVVLNGTNVRSFAGLSCLRSKAVRININVDKGEASFSTLEWLVEKEFLPSNWTVIINDYTQYRDQQYTEL